MVSGFYNRINGRKQCMELSEQRIFSSLVLLAGITFLAAGVATGQLTTVIDIISKVLGTATAG
jgi:hypothetical protein